MNNKEDIRRSVNNINKEEIRRSVNSIFSDLSKASVSKQMILGGAAGWCTGFVTMRVGKIAAFALGGGIILLQVAHHQGYIRVNWDKVQRQVDRVTDRVEQEATGEAPQWMDKAERFVDRKLKQAEDTVKRNRRRAQRWYHSFIGEDEFKFNDLHVFTLSFVAGIAIGIASS